MSLADRQQFTQIDEPYTDRFVLGDLTTEIDFGDVVMTRDRMAFLHSLTDEALLLGTTARAGSPHPLRQRQAVTSASAREQMSRRDPQLRLGVN